MMIYDLAQIRLSLIEVILPSKDNYVINLRLTAFGIYPTYIFESGLVKENICRLSDHLYSIFEKVTAHEYRNQFLNLLDKKILTILS